ncbi:SAR2788 family putative toxin [Bacillus sp. UMB0728]|uniref:SAR2788 family putative toxin n=1 Tax=Bacillus sp. UMB0728 TaxID=2066052 RepID=UPI001C60DA33|nr:SAR2788 family putative toxin [Bacillus sp. UMB0728]
MKKIISQILALTLLISLMPNSLANAQTEEVKSTLKVSNNETMELKALNFNEDTEEHIITVEIYREETKSISVQKDYKLILNDADEENFEAVLIDQKDGTELTLNDEEFQTLALPLVPLVVAFIAKQGLKAAINKYGKTTLTKLLKDNESVAKAVSKELGYNEVKGQFSHGAKVYQRGKGKGPKFITRDKDGHIGGAWKGATSVKNLRN